jgi:hypothetical protein
MRHAPVVPMSCRCHSDPIYAGLIDCPECGHSSLDVGKGWAGCERRACGWETEDRRSYRRLMRWPVWGLYGGEALVATIRAESAQAARVLFIGAGLRGERVRRVAVARIPTLRP